MLKHQLPCNYLSKYRDKETNRVLDLKIIILYIKNSVRGIKGFKFDIVLQIVIQTHDYFSDNFFF